MSGAFQTLKNWTARLRRSAAFADAVDLEDPAVRADPYSAYRRLRKKGEVLFLPRHDFWIALSHQAVRSAFSQPTLFSNAAYQPIDTVLLAADPPAHGAVRRIVSRHFGGRMLNLAEAEAKKVAASLLRPRLDVVAGYGLPLSRAVTCLVIGFDEGVADHLAACEEALRTDPHALAKLIAELDSVAHRSAMFRRLQADEPGALDEAQCRSLVRLMWLAGTVTTERVITRCVFHCLEDSTLANALRQRPELRGAFIDEVLRLYPPEHMVPRRTTADAELGGVVIPAGSLVQLCTASANRDPERYAQPDDFLIERGNREHFTLGHGIHACLGGPLARRIIAAALSTLLDAPGGFGAAAPLAATEWLATTTTLTPRRLEIGWG
ncbi:MAG TPA: cytochrome P450 [Allosphingosinicella sp.]